MTSFSDMAVQGDYSFGEAIMAPGVPELDPYRPYDHDLVIVEDEMDQLNLLRMVSGMALQQQGLHEGFKQEIISRGPTLYDYLKDNDPAVVVLDYNLPGRTSLEVLAQLHEEEVLDKKRGVFIVNSCGDDNWTRISEFVEANPQYADRFIFHPRKGEKMTPDQIMDIVPKAIQSQRAKIQQTVAA